ncbi:hypothetical protein McanMca71_003059 [Microsporum canis]|uniref:Uncharacterized protein n=1 Tax=Arthroderma otae (strain ATCC MYA-4605 / CBS 113480) TaxID=554155 RepID=C5G075_ARTOC|nr:uncharacterized protein MCYG_08347 [Microsporum canis CBS 113480]EEQ35528.1 predicted protein [Microsporum canis CBS 113480]
MPSLVRALVLAGAFGCSLALSPIDPPKFPENCQVPTEAPAIRVINLPPGRGIPNSAQCFAVGDPCKVKSDCRRPTKAECSAHADNGKITIPIQSQCLEGFCRGVTLVDNAPCDCILGCDVANHLNCIAGKCLREPCAPCGEELKGRSCCGSGVKGHDGKCHCWTGVGEGCGVDPKQCGAGEFNDECCARGTDNEGKCCASGTCNGKCLHQPK